MINNLFLSVIALVFYFGIFRGYSFLSIKKRLELKYVFFSLLSIFIFIILILLFNNNPPVLKKNLSLIASPTGLYKLFLIFIIIAIPEELFFRGTVIELLFKLNNKYNILKSLKSAQIVYVLISTIIFAFLHFTNLFNISNFIFIISFGLLSGFLLIKTKKLLYSISIHLVLNYFLL